MVKKMYPVREHTFVSPSAESRRADASYCRKYVHLLQVNRVGGLNLPGNSVARLADRPDITIAVYSGRKATKQQEQNQKKIAQKRRIDLLFQNNIMKEFMTQAEHLAELINFRNIYFQRSYFSHIY